MKYYSVVFLVLLACNPLALIILFASLGVEWISYINLLGCIVFGHMLRDFKGEIK